MRCISRGRIPGPFAPVGIAAIALGTLTLACAEEAAQPVQPPPPPAQERPADPGLSYDPGCVHDGPIDLPLSGGGGPPGSIPALVDPGFLSVNDVDYLLAEDLVFGVELEGRFYAFPARILNYHEIVNFSVETGRYAATWCPLSYSFILAENRAWDASTPARLGSFMVSGALMDNNLVMVDLETSTVWPQLGLQGVSGERTGDCLGFGRNAVATTWEFWRLLHPETVVLTNQNQRQTAIKPAFYATNPYEDYWEERIDPPTWPVTHMNDRLPRQEIVLGVHGKNGSAAVLVDDPVSQAVIGDTPVVFFHHPSSNTTFAFENRVKGRSRFFAEHDTDSSGLPTFKDLTDGTVWSIDGVAIQGPMAAEGARLPQMPAVQVYWFVWATFFPEARLHVL